MENMQIKEYLNSLASKNYTPGGGSAVCLNSNIAISLILKSINITQNRKSYEEEDRLVKRSLDKAKEYLTKSIDVFYKLADLDEKSFNNFMKAYKEKLDIEQASIDCFNVPKNTFDKIIECINISSDLKIASSIVSDYDIGINMLKSCLNSCLKTMKININGYDDLKEKYNDYLEIYKKVVE